MSIAVRNSKFASKTAFDVLAVDDDDDSVVASEPEPPSENTAHPPPAKLSKTAAKKAAKAAREARQKKKAEPSTSNGTAARQTERSVPPSNENSSAASSLADTLPPPATAQVQETPKPASGVDVPAPSQPATVSIVTEQKPPPKPDAKPPIVAEPPPVQAMPEKKDFPPSSAVAPPPPAPQEAERVKKRQNVITRTLWTFIMIGGFIGLLLLGHVYMIILVMVCQTIVYREVTALFSLKSSSAATTTEKGRDPWSKTLNWYWFAVTNYFLYGESIIYYFKHVIFSDSLLLPFATNHRIISFTLYTIGFMGFVMSLKKGYLKQQFGLFCWAHMTLLLIVVSSHFIVNNILEGMIWFWVPASLVICNDVFAYIWGITIGRTPLIKLSPKKTVEGFVGAFFSTLIFSLLWGTYFMRFNYMICPARSLGVSAWDGMECTPNPVFVWREWVIWAPVQKVLASILGLSLKTIPWTPYQFHLLSMACFASLVAPFGGFFASGFKRAFDVKDFGDSIPGHGGMTDRMDCQFLMGVFTYVYYSSLIRQHNVTVGGVLQTIVSGLTIEQQLEVIADLKTYLEGQGVKVPL